MGKYIFTREINDSYQVFATFNFVDIENSIVMIKLDRENEEFEEISILPRKVLKDGYPEESPRISYNISPDNQSIILRS